MRKVAGTCGCFDLFHDGHVSILQACSLIADEVVVFLNSDESITRIKGQEKPFTPLEMRYRILSANKYVNYIIAFNEDTPVEALKTYFENNTDVGCGNFFWLKPAADYALTGIPEREIIQERGGIILYYDSPVKRSSSEMARRIKEGVNALSGGDWKKEFQ